MVQFRKNDCENSKAGYELIVKLSKHFLLYLFDIFLSELKIIMICLKYSVICICDICNLTQYYIFMENHINIYRILLKNA